MMDHPRIDDERILDRYLVGRLAAADEEHFEEHLFACAECLQQVQAGEELRRGLRAVAAEDAARATLSLGLMAWLRSRNSRQLAGVLSVALALVVLPTLLVRQQQELNRLRSASAPVSVPASLAVPASPSGLAEPTGNLLVVSLGVVRDAGDAVEIQTQAGKNVVLLSLELPTVSASRYRATLMDAVGKVLWQGEDLEPNLYDSLLVALPSSYLEPGTYRIFLEGLSPAGAEAAGEIPFRVLPER